MGNAPNAVVAITNEHGQYWAEVQTGEHVRQTKCGKCRRVYAVLWLHVISVRVTTQVPLRRPRYRGEQVPTEEVLVSNSARRSEIEQAMPKILNRPANAEHGIMTAQGWQCHSCLKLKDEE